MAFRELKDIKDSAVYQRNLRAALLEAQTETMEFMVWQAFPFSEQTAQLIIVAKSIENSLIRKIADNGAHKLGFGKCRAIGRKLVFKPENSLSANAISTALKIAKIAAEVDVVGKGADLDAGVQAGARAQTQVQGAPVANAAQDAAHKAVAASYPKLVERLEEAETRTRDMKERTTLTQLRRKIGSEWEDKDYVAVKALLDPVDKAVAAVEKRLEERDKQQGLHAQLVKKLQGRYETAQAAVPAALFKKAMTAWSGAAQFAAKDEYAEAGKLLAALPSLLDAAERAARDAWKERLKQEQEGAAAQLDSPTEGETALLKARATAVEEQIAKLDVARIESALGAFETTVQALANARRQRQLAELAYERAETLWTDQQYNLRDPAEKKARAAFQNAGKLMGEAKTKAEAGQIAKAFKNAAVACRQVVEIVTAELQARNALSEKLANESAELEAAMNQSATEDAAAVAYGNQHFTSGMLKDIWKAAVKAQGDNPPNGSIGGVWPLSTVEGAIDAWRSTANSGVLSNFHVPGGGRPQAKWEKNFVRAEIQANFCVRWRGNRINIHVDVEPRSYFDVYGDEVDWSLIPQSIRAQLGRG